MLRVVRQLFERRRPFCVARRRWVGQMGRAQIGLGQIGLGQIGLGQIALVEPDLQHVAADNPMARW